MQLNVEQKRIIESKPNGHLLVKGVAGSGKTTVAVNKIPLLLNNYCIDDDDKILMVTYNKSLSRYVSYIYKDVKENTKVQGSFFNMSDEDEKLDIKNIDSLMFCYFSEYKKENNINISIASSFETQKALKDAIISIAKRYDNKLFILDEKYYSFYKEEIMWIKACDFMELEVYQSIDRIGRTIVSKNNDGPQKLRKNSEMRKAIFDVMLKYNDNLKKINKIDFQDMALIALKEARRRKIYKYTHILIDESQDLSRVQLEFLKCLHNEKSYSSKMFLADVAQSIYPQAWLIKNRSFTSIGYDMTGKSYSLSKNYRTTTQIAQAAFSLIKKDRDLVEDDKFVKPNLIDKQGKYPIFQSFQSAEEEGLFVANLIKNKLIKNYSMKDIVIIARLKNQLLQMKDCLEKNNVKCSIFEKQDEFDFAEESIKLVTMHSIKGLEFKIVIIIGANSKILPYISNKNDLEDIEVIESRERKLLYVGMTRATERLYITCSKTPSKFIKDIDYKYLRIKEDCDFRRIYHIDLEDYLFKDKLDDIYGEEEKVRQYILKELIETYKYPIDLLDIEYKVNIGSRSGKVDVVINILDNNEKVPFIFVEAKRWGSGVEDALSQLKSYLSSSKTVKYGIACDGNQIAIIDNNLRYVNDIPKFNSNMMPLTLEKIKYIDLRKNEMKTMIIDSTNSKDIYIEEDGIENKVENVRKIYINSQIAAGRPIQINDNYEGEYYLPESWIGEKDAFILKINGDSMINKNIYNGDHVVISKQNYAEIGEIVAVDIDGECTLKTFKTMGGKILLMPENDEYEPIMLDEDQVRIIGRAIGIIKN